MPDAASVHDSGHSRVVVLESHHGVTVEHCLQLVAGIDTKKEPDPDIVVRPVRGSTSGTPGWVKVFAVIAIVLVLAFVAYHLAGGGMGVHIP